MQTIFLKPQASIALNAVVHLCEDTAKSFDLAPLLAAAGYNQTGTLNITQMYVLGANGLPDSTVPASLFTKVDGDTVKVDASVFADRNWTFNTLAVVIDNGVNQVTLKLQVIVDPVNDAPTAEDHTIALGTATSYVVKVTDFGFADPHDANSANQANPAGNNLMSVIITVPPISGSLLLNGVAVTVGQEIAVGEITAGHLVYQVNPNVSGQTAFGFEVRDDGGLAGCNPADTSIQHFLTFDAPHGALGDRVWFDTNGNGVQDSTEAGAANVTVTLIGGGADGVIGTGGDDVVLGTKTTDANGNYLFDHLAPGQYQVQFGKPADYVFTGRDLGSNDATDSDANVANGLSQVVTLGKDETNLTVDAGLIGTNAKLGDKIWFDTNANGLQDAGEAGASGLTVTLKGAGADGQFGTFDDVVLKTAVTDANGNYLFAGLNAGQYQVQFSKGTDYAYTGRDLGGNDANDSDANTTTGLSQVVTLGQNETNLTIDAGLVGNNAKLGDKIWFDTNGNGLQDTGEAGASGLTVTLKGAGADGQFGTFDDVVLNTATTDAKGNYLFSGLNAGQYQVQ
ncbi:MAG: hypothetical protein JWP29_2589, partial [Rhodoferax sp.]|nr:hypothetical protein [Rhodoferax sp.]